MSIGGVVAIFQCRKYSKGEWREEKNGEGSKMEVGRLWEEVEPVVMLCDRSYPLWLQPPQLLSLLRLMPEKLPVQVQGEPFWGGRCMEE